MTGQSVGVFAAHPVQAGERDPELLALAGLADSMSTAALREARIAASVMR